MCHLILFMPVLAVPILWLVPLNLSIPIYALIVLVSGLLYRIIVKSIRKKPETGKEGLIGGIAEVVSSNQQPAGYLVRTQGELWNATSMDTLQTGDTVNVLAIDHLKLLVGRKDRSNTEIADERHCH